MPNEKVPDLFKGHLSECLRHFAKALDASHPPGTSGAAQARQPFAEFCGVKKNTVHSWFRRSFNVKTPEWVRVCCYLTMMGYYIVEWQRLDRRIRNLGELIAFGVVDVGELTKQLGYADSHGIYTLARGQHNPSAEKQEVLWSLFKEHREALAQAKVDAENKYAIALGGDTSHDLEAEDKDKEEEKEEPVQDKHMRENTPSSADAVLDIMSGLVKLLEHKPFEGLTPAQFAKMNERAGHPIVLLLGQLGELSAQLVPTRQRR